MTYGTVAAAAGRLAAAPAANRGAPGVDAINIREFERHLEANLAELGRNLLDRTYEPLPARYVDIPKPNGTRRELAIPTVVS